MRRSFVLLAMVLGAPVVTSADPAPPAIQMGPPPKVFCLEDSRLFILPPSRASDPIQMFAFNGDLKAALQTLCELAGGKANFDATMPGLKFDTDGFQSGTAVELINLVADAHHLKVVRTGKDYSFAPTAATLSMDKEQVPVPRKGSDPFSPYTDPKYKPDLVPGARSFGFNGGTVYHVPLKPS